MRLRSGQAVEIGRGAVMAVTLSHASELRDALVGSGLTEGVNLLVRAGDGVVQVHLMAVDLSRLGLLLATLSDPAELADPGALSGRVTPGGNDGAGGWWQYELITGRYPHSGEIVLPC